MSRSTPVEVCGITKNSSRVIIGSNPVHPHIV